jgi:hypothetical protein
MYYVLEEQVNRSPIVGSVGEDQHALANRFARGHRFPPDEEPQNLFISVEYGPQHYPDYFELQATPVASQRLVQALADAGVDNFDAYPVVIRESTREVENYFVLNFVGRVSCLDEDATRCTRYRGRVARIQSLAIDENRAMGFALFRLHEYELLLLVSEYVKRSLEGMDGVLLSEAQGWSDRHRF